MRGNHRFDVAQRIIATIELNPPPKDWIHMMWALARVRLAQWQRYASLADVKQRNGRRFIDLFSHFPFLIQNESQRIIFVWERKSRRTRSRQAAHAFDARTFDAMILIATKADRSLVECGKQPSIPNGHGLKRSTCFIFIGQWPLPTVSKSSMNAKRTDRNKTKCECVAFNTSIASKIWIRHGNPHF